MPTRQEIYSLAQKIQGKYSFGRYRTQFLQAAKSGKASGQISDREFKELMSYYRAVQEGRHQESLLNLEQSYYEGKTVGVKLETIEAEKEASFAGYKSPLLEQQRAAEEQKKLQEQQQAQAKKLAAAQQQARENLRPVGMSLEEYRRKTGTQTKEEKAKELVSQINLRRALPITTATIPLSQRIELQAQTVQPKQKPSTELDPTLSAGTIKRVEALVEREKKVEQVRTNIKGFFGIQREEGESFIKGTAKVVAGLPVDIVLDSFKVGGRIPAAIDITQAQIRQGITFGQLETVRAAKETPKAVVQSLNPTTPEGLVNLALAAVAVKGVASARAQARAKPTFTAEEAVTKRVTTKGLTIDETYVDVKAALNKKVIEVKGRGTQSFIEIGEGQFGVKGVAELTELSSKKVTSVETRGLATKIEGGFDVTSISKVKTGKSTKTVLDITQSAELISEPTQVFKTISKSVELPKGKTIYEGTPSRISTGVTGEIFVEDIRAPTGKSIFRKEILSEFGEPLAVEQTLATNRFGINAEQFTKQFEAVPRQPDLSRTFQERQSFRPVTVEGGAQATQLKTLEVLKVPTQENILSQIAKQTAESSISKVKTSQITKSISQSGASVSGVTIGVSQVQASLAPAQQISYEVQRPAAPINVAKPLAKTTAAILPAATTKALVDTSVRALPKIKTGEEFSIKTEPTIRPETSTKPILEIGTEPALDIKPSTDVRPVIDVKPMFDVEPVVSQKPRIDTRTVVQPKRYYPQPVVTPFPEVPFTPPPPMLPDFEAGGFYLPESTGKPKKVSGKKFDYQLPSVESVVFNIRSTSFPKIQAITGLGTRPIKI